MISETQYAEARRWIAENKQIYDECTQIINEYQSQRDFEQPFRGTHLTDKVDDVFDRFTANAIKNVLPSIANYQNLLIADLAKLSEKEWRNAYGIGPVTVGMIKAAVEAAGLKLRP